jgi:hypothetical protein
MNKEEEKENKQQMVARMQEKGTLIQCCQGRGDINCCNHYGNQYRGSLKHKRRPNLCPCHTSLGYISKGV